MGRDDEAARAALRLSLLAAPGGGCGCDQGLEPNSPFPSSRSPETFPGVCPMRSHRWGQKACDLRGPRAFAEALGCSLFTWLMGTAEHGRTLQGTPKTSEKALPCWEEVRPSGCLGSWRRRGWWRVPFPIQLHLSVAVLPRCCSRSTCAQLLGMSPWCPCCAPQLLPDQPWSPGTWAVGSQGQGQPQTALIAPLLVIQPCSWSRELPEKPKPQLCSVAQSLSSPSKLGHARNVLNQLGKHL